MSFTAMRAIDEHIRTPMSGTARAVLQVLAGSYNDVERAAWPRIETLMEKTGRARPTIFRAIDQLVALQIVVRERGVGRGHFDTFRLPCVEKRLDGKGLTSETKGITTETLSGQEKVSLSRKKGLTSDQEKVSLLIAASIRETVRETVSEPGESHAPAREDAPTNSPEAAPAKAATKPRQVADTPHQLVIDVAFHLWDIEHLDFPGGKARVIADLAGLLGRCPKNADQTPDPADAIALLYAFHRGLNGDRPDFRTVANSLGRWQLAGKPDVYDGRYQPRKEPTVAERLFASSGALGPLRTEADTQREWGADIAIAAEQRKKRESFLRMRNDARDQS